MTLRNLVSHCLVDDSGSVAIEYTVILAAMALAVLTAIPSIADATLGKFIDIGSFFGLV
jgi:Flp pilus assembly pilin Flp